MKKLNNIWYEQYEVIMLAATKPREKHNMIHKAYDDNTLRIWLYDSTEDSTVWIPQELYLLSSDKIEDGDWWFDVLERKVYQASKAELKMLNHNRKAENGALCKKIVATTDISLEIKQEIKYGSGSGDHIEVTLPTIPHNFMYDYVEANGDINKVLVELLKLQINLDCIEGGPAPYDGYIIKQNKDNTIIINSIQEEKKYTIDDIREAVNMGLTLSTMTNLPFTDEVFIGIKENLIDKTFNK